MTNVEIAYRKARIADAFAECPPHGICAYGWGLLLDLYHDLLADGVSHDVAWHIVCA